MESAHTKKIKHQTTRWRQERFEGCKNHKNSAQRANSWHTGAKKTPSCYDGRPLQQKTLCDSPLSIFSFQETSYFSNLTDSPIPVLQPDFEAKSRLCTNEQSMVKRILATLASGSVHPNRKRFSTKFYAFFILIFFDSPFLHRYFSWQTQVSVLLWVSFCKDLKTFSEATQCTGKSRISKPRASTKTPHKQMTQSSQG